MFLEAAEIQGFRLTVHVTAYFPLPQFLFNVAFNLMFIVISDVKSARPGFSRFRPGLGLDQAGPDLKMVCFTLLMYLYFWFPDRFWPGLPKLFSQCLIRIANTFATRCYAWNTRIRPFVINAVLNERFKRFNYYY